MDNAAQLIEVIKLRETDNESLRTEYYHGTTSFTTDCDAPLAYVREDGCLDIIHVKRLVVMTDKLADSLAAIEAEEMEFNEYCITAVSVNFENMENYHEKKPDGSQYDIMASDEVSPDIRAILSSEPHYGISDVEGLMTAPDEIYYTTADITYDSTLKHELVPEWHNVKDFIMGTRMIIVCDIGGRVDPVPESHEDLMYTTYNVKVVLQYCLR